MEPTPMRRSRKAAACSHCCAKSSRRPKPRSSPRRSPARRARRCIIPIERSALALERTRMNDLLRDAAQRAAAYLDSLDTRPVRPDPAAAAALDALDVAMPVPGTDDARVLAELDRFGSPATMAMAGPRFFGFVIGGSLPVTLAANWLAGAWDQNTALYNATPATSRIEQIALRWLVELLGLPPETGGGFVTGATV